MLTSQKVRFVTILTETAVRPGRNGGTSTRKRTGPHAARPVRGLAVTVVVGQHEPMTSTGDAMNSTEHGDRSARRAGVVARYAAAYTLVVLLVPGGVAVFADGWASLYGPGHWALWAILTGSGLVLLKARPAFAGAAATAGALAAVQLCGTGIWAVRHWEPFTGMGGWGEPVLWLLRPLAAGLALACAAVAVACALAVLHSGAWQPAAGPRRWLPVAAGALLAAGLPVVLLGGLGPITMLGTYGLLYSLPWGAAIAATGLLRRDAAITAGVLAVTGPLAVAGWQLSWDLYYGHSGRPYLLTLLAAALLAAAATAVPVLRARPTPS